MTDLTPLRKYQAFGTVEGVLSLSKRNTTLLVGDATFPVFAHIPKQVRQYHLPGEIQCFRVFPFSHYGKLSFKVLKISKTPADGLKLKGCWIRCKGDPYLAVYRNSLDSPNDEVLRILVPINAPEPDGKFWELEGEIQGEGITIIKADGPFRSPPRAREYYPPEEDQKPPRIVAESTRIPKAIPAEATPTTAPTALTAAKAKAQAQPTTAATPATPLTPQQILAMATPAKISLTCKLNQVPAHRELPDKQIEFFLNDGSDRIFTVRVKPKMFKKLTDHGFAQWVAAISGDLGASTETGFELLNASIQVFEKKTSADASAGQAKAPVKEAKATSEKAAASAVARPEPPKAEAQAGAGKRKSLLDGVRLK
jgi:hypothetical protein